MCDVIVADDGVDIPLGRYDEISTPGEIRAAGWTVHTLGGVPPDELLDDECLCTVDIPAVLDAAGATWTNLHWGYMVTAAPPPPGGDR